MLQFHLLPDTDFVKVLDVADVFAVARALFLDKPFHVFKLEHEERSIFFIFVAFSATVLEQFLGHFDLMVEVVETQSNAVRVNKRLLELFILFRSLKRVIGTKTITVAC